MFMEYETPKWKSLLMMQKKLLVIQKILYLPKLGTNEFSIGAATENLMEVFFMNNRVYFFCHGKLKFSGKRTGRTQFHLDNIKSLTYTEETTHVDTKETSINTWHQWLTHVKTRTIRRMFTQQLVD